MDTNEGPPPKGEVRPLTQQLIQSAMFDTWPGNAAVMDFGIESDRHLGALHHAIRYGEVTPEELDAAMGNGEKLTEIAQRGNNPYGDVSFHTAWDDMPLEPEEPEPPASKPLPPDPELDQVISEMEQSWTKILATPEPARDVASDFLKELTSPAKEDRGR